MAKVERKRLPDADRRKLVGMLSRLSSDNDNEVLVSARMAVALLQKHNAPWDDIIAEPTDPIRSARENPYTNRGHTYNYHAYPNQEDVRRQWEKEADRWQREAEEQARRDWAHQEWARQQQDRREREQARRDEAQRKAGPEGPSSSPYLQYNDPRVRSVLDGMDSIQAADFCIRSAWLWSQKEQSFLFHRYTRWSLTEDELRRLTGMYEKSKVWGGYSPKHGTGG
jgi:hypothetical protein